MILFKRKTKQQRTANQIIRERRLKLELSYEEAAKKCNVSRSVFYRVENDGRIRSCRFETMVFIALGLDIDLYELADTFVDKL